jgi:hypothetical protein
VSNRQTHQFAPVASCADLGTAYPTRVSSTSCFWAAPELASPVAVVSVEAVFEPEQAATLTLRTTPTTNSETKLLNELSLSGYLRILQRILPDSGVHTNDSYPTLPPNLR